MKSKEVQICNYIKSIYLPKYLIRNNDDVLIFDFNVENIKPLANSKFTLKEISDYILLHKSSIVKQLTNQLVDKVFEPIYFTIEELLEIQSSDDPFLKEELCDLLDTELAKPYKEMNVDVVEFCLSEIEDK